MKTKSRTILRNRWRRGENKVTVAATKTDGRFIYGNNGSKQWSVDLSTLLSTSRDSGWSWRHRQQPLARLITTLRKSADSDTRSCAAVFISDSVKETWAVGMEFTQARHDQKSTDPDPWHFKYSRIYLIFKYSQEL